ncbi:MAG: aldo/keto reductase [bacterium]|nr:aldo/keto reductase [bacterium]
MQLRTLGETDLSIPPIVFGAWAIGGWCWGGADDEQSIEAIRASIDAGASAIDTAPVYGFGRSEEVVGRAIAGRTGEVVVMTKVGLRWDLTDGDRFFETEDGNGDSITIYRNSRPESIRWEVEQSLARLGVERIDLCQVHWHDPTTPIEDTMGALAALVGEGKIRAVGVSNYTVEQMQEAQRALGAVPLASDQPKYSLVARGIEADVLPWAREHSVGVLAYSPLEQGLLTGSVRADRRFPPGDARNKRPTFQPAFRSRVNDILDSVVAPIAERHGASIGQTVLAWTIAQPGMTAVLVGARSAAQARENAAAGAVQLEPAECAAIDAAFRGVEPAPPGKLRALLRKVVSRTR